MEHEQTHRIAGLFIRYINDDLDEASKAALLAWANANEQNQQLFRELTDRHSLANKLEAWENSLATSDPAWQKLLALGAVPADSGFRIRKMAWTKWLVAASVVMAVWVTGYFLSKGDNNTTIVKTDDTDKKVLEKDIAPANESAILYVDGQQFILDSVQNGDLIEQAGIRVIKKDGQVTYEFVNKPAGNEVKYHTMATAKGKDYKLLLADGTQVWMNAESTIRYPTSFTGNERKVEVTGELFFDVAKVKLPSGERMPFIVQSGDVSIQVTGTRFNVNAYDNEATVKTTLVEGSVNVTTAGSDKKITLKPGQQAQVNDNDIRLVNNADIPLETAWVDGLFRFNKTDLKSVMRQLSRWYDIEVDYNTSNTNLYINGEVPRSSNISAVLDVLEYMGAHLKVEGNKVTVLP